MADTLWYPIPSDAVAVPAGGQSLLDLIEGVRMDVDGATLRPSTSSSVLPPCRRLDRAAVRGRVRRRRPPSRRARRRPRRRAAADEHPARRPRGRRAGGCYLPARTSRASARRAPGRRSPRWSPSRPRAPGSGSRAVWSCCRARPPQRRLCARDERHLPAPARADRGRSGGDAGAARVVGTPEKAASRPQPARAHARGTRRRRRRRRRASPRRSTAPPPARR